MIKVKGDPIERVTKTVTKKPMTVAEIRNALRKGRPRKHASNAERQRMFRLRKKTNG